MKFTTILFITLLSGRILSQTTVEQINGMVIDEKDGTPLEDVMVIFQEIPAIKRTNYDGKFTFDVKGLNISIYTKHSFYFVKKGYEKQEVNLQVPIVETIKLKPALDKSIYVQVLEDAKKTTFVQNVLVSVNGEWEAYTDKLGFAVVEIPPTFDEIKPFRLACQSKFLYEDKVENNLVYRNINSVIEIRLKKTEVAFGDLHDKFLKSIEDIGTEVESNPQDYERLFLKMKELVELFIAIRGLTNLSSTEEQKRAKIYGGDDSPFFEIFLHTNQMVSQIELGIKTLDTIYKEHERKVVEFKSLMSNFYKDSMDLSKIPDRIDYLFSLGDDVIRSKFIIGDYFVKDYKMSMKELIKVDLEELSKLIEAENIYLREYSDYMNPDLIEKYKKSINKNYNIIFKLTFELVKK